MEGEAPNIVGVSPSDDHAELHGPIECLMRARCIHEQGGWHSITSAFLHPWPHVEDAQAYVQPVFLGAHPPPPKRRGPSDDYSRILCQSGGSCTTGMVASTERPP